MGFGIGYLCQTCPKPTLANLLDFKQNHLQQQRAESMRDLGNLPIQNFGVFLITWNTIRGILKPKILHELLQTLLQKTTPQDAVEYFQQEIFPQLQLVDFYHKDTTLQPLISWWTTYCECARNELNILSQDQRRSFTIQQEAWPDFPISPFQKSMHQLRDHVCNVINQRLVSFPSSLSYIYTPVLYICDPYTSVAGIEWGKTSGFIVTKMVDRQRVLETIQQTVRLSPRVNYIIVWFTDFDNLVDYSDQITKLLTYLKDFERPVVLIPPYKYTFNVDEAIQPMLDLYNTNLCCPPRFTGGQRSFYLHVIKPVMCVKNPHPMYLDKLNRPSPNGISDIPYLIRGLNLEFRLPAEMTHEQVAQHTQRQNRPMSSTSSRKDFGEETFVAAVKSVTNVSKYPDESFEFLDVRKSQNIDFILQQHAKFRCDSDRFAKGKFTEALEKVIRRMLQLYPRDYNNLKYGKLFATGSFITQVDTKDSDLDLCWYLPSTLANFPLLTGELARARSRSRSKSHVRLSDVDQELFDLSRLLNSASKNGFDLIQRVELPKYRLEKKRIHMLTLHTKQELSMIPKIEIGIKNVLGIFNSHLIRFYTRADPRIATLGKALKIWGKSVKLIDSQHQAFNAYSIIIMLIYYFIVEDLVPNFQITFPSLFDINTNPANFEAYDLLPAAKGQRSTREHRSLKNILIGFLKFWRDFDWKHFSVSVRHGKPMPRPTVGMSKRFPGYMQTRADSDDEDDDEGATSTVPDPSTPQSEGPTVSRSTDAVGLNDPLFINEPFDDNDNVARTIKNHEKAAGLLEMMYQEGEKEAVNVLKACCPKAMEDATKQTSSSDK